MTSYNEHGFGSGSVCLWGRMPSCARVANPRCGRRLAIGAQVNNLPHTLKVTHYYGFRAAYNRSIMRLARLPALRSRALLVLALSVLPAQLFAQTTRLEPGRTFPGELSGEQKHSYSITLDANQYLRVDVTQPIAAVVVELDAPDGKKVLEVDTRRFPRKPARIVWVAETKGEYLLNVNVPDKQADARHYEIGLEEPRPAGAEDRKRAEAERLFSQGLDEASKKANDQAIATYTRALSLYREIQDRERQGDTLIAVGAAYDAADDSKKAIDCYEQALAIGLEIKDGRGAGAAAHSLGNAYHGLGQIEKAIGYYEQAVHELREAKDRNSEGATLYNLGIIYTRQGKVEKGIAFYEQALAIFQDIKSRRREATTLNNLSNSWETLSQHEKAIGYLERALAISREIKDRGLESSALSNLGGSYWTLSEYEKAIFYYEQALPIERERKDRRSEATTLNGLAVVSFELSRYEKALEYGELSLAISREIEDRAAVGRSLGNLGLVYFGQSQYEKAMDYYEQSLGIAREVKNRRGESSSLHNLGNACLMLGQYEKAIGYYEQALAIDREATGRREEGATLADLGDAYRHLDQHEKAIGLYEQSLKIARDVKDRKAEGNALGNLGSTYAVLSQYEKAIGYYQQALAIEREIGDRQDEGESLSNIGESHYKLKQYEKAAAFYAQSLGISREVKDRRNEANELSGLMDTLEASGRPRLAIFYGKQAVNTVQSMRSDIRGLKPDVQQSFLKLNEKSYHTLAEILIREGRLAEAEQVLALLKEEEYFQYIRRDAGEATALSRRADLTPEEAEYEKRYREIGDRLMTIGVERGDLLALAKRTTLSPNQSQRLERLELDLAAGNQAFEHFLGDLTQHFSAQPEMAGRVKDLREMQSIMEDLREFPAGTVAIFTLIGEDKFYTVLRTPDAQKAYEYPIKAADLNRKISEFREVVLDPTRDPRPLARELYKILIAGMVDDLRQAKAQTLMWSLDGALRYVPLAALYDGKQYLIERYRISVLTLASYTRLKDRPDQEWKAAGFGVTKGFEDASALPSVSSELSGIITTKTGDGGVLAGEIKLDDQFTQQSMRDTLRKGYPVVHIASHFRFQPGNDSKSFLLMGDGRHLTLEELKTSANMFGGVQLLTLSACNTGMGDGAEVEGFGTLAQRQGAKAVVASLWPVADESTSLLMREFYRIRESSAGMTKLEALREAQLRLLRGEVQIEPAVERARGDVTNGTSSSGTSSNGTSSGAASPDAPSFPLNTHAPYAHPYYWAPFFLMGNWL
jgi:CHAT domain-containing protein/Tfp pilus assembly protein PilF